MNLEPAQNPEPLEPARQLSGTEAAAGSIRDTSTRHGQAYSPPPNVTRKSGDDSPATRGSGSVVKRSIGLALIVAAAVGLAAWYGAATRPPANHPPIATAVDRADKALTLVAADIGQQATAQLKAALGSGSPSFSSGKVANAPALAKLGEISPEIADDIKNGRRNLYQITLLDFLAQDGDRIEFFADGVSYGLIDLKNAGKTLLIPLVPGKTTTFKIVATTDGGGGVTVGFITSLDEVRTDVLQVGQFETWQVTVQ